jgi:hypothetical protein
LRISLCDSVNIDGMNVNARRQQFGVLELQAPQGLVDGSSEDNRPAGRQRGREVAREAKKLTIKKTQNRDATVKWFQKQIKRFVT